MRSSSTQRPLHAVLVCHAMAPANVVARIGAIVARCGRPLRGVAVCNRRFEGGLESPLDGVELIRGSNDHLDFSGYFEGLAHLRATTADALTGNVVFANDSLLLKHAAATILGRVIGLDALLAALAVPAAAGKFDPYRSVSLRNPWSGHAGYLSTYCFALNPAAQPALEHLLADAARDGALVDAPLRDPAWGASMDPVLREQIRAHLIYPGSPVRWPGAAGASPELLAKKARCVYFEQRLSGAIGARGALLPINSGPRATLAIALAEVGARLLNGLGTGRRR